MNMRIIKTGEYLMQVRTINRAAYYDSDMEMSIWVHKNGKIRYYYWLEVYITRLLEASL